MRYSIRTVTPATAPLLSLDQAKAHLRVTASDEDELIDALNRAAQDYVERYTSRLLVPQTLEFACDGFPCGSSGTIVIPRDPITAISAIEYTDADGTAVDLEESDWRWSESAPDQVLVALNTSWPTALAEPGSVRIEFVAGYEEGLCPPALGSAVRLMLGTLYSQREGVVLASQVAELPLGVAALCAPYRRIAV